MARVTANEVLTIMDEGCDLSTEVVTTIIESAHVAINKIFEYSSEGASSALLKEIERWFTAHMIASSLYRTAHHEEIGEAKVIYTGKWGEGLRSTPYGQMVLTMDVTGTMANTGKMAARIFAIPSFEK